ncbi:MAG: DUF4199 domain-containing protein [Bacteroidales bacterium]|nr:DUF4199 domain-containing protein [Bacteroidales bacterium]
MKFDRIWTNHILTHGIVLGISLSAVEFAALYMGLLFNSAMFNIFVLLIALSVYIAVRKFRETALKGLIKFGEAFVTGIVMCAVAGFIWAVYRFMQYSFAPGIIEELVRIKSAAFEQTEMAAADKELFLKLLRAFSTPFSLALLNTFFINMILGGAFISMLMGYLLQRKELPRYPEF